MFVPFPSYPTRSAARRPDATHKMVAACKLTIFVLLVCCGGWLLFQQTVHGQIRDRVQAKISDSLRDTGLTAHVGQARFHEGKGIQLNDVQIDLAGTAPAKTQSRLEIYEAFIHSPISMAQLASFGLKVRAVGITRAKLTVVRTPDGQWDFQHIVDSLLAFHSDSSIPISLTDCQIRIVDQSNLDIPEITLTNVSLVAVPEDYNGRTLLKISGGFQSPAISKIKFTTFLDNQAQAWQSHISAIDANLSGDLIGFLPRSVRYKLQDFQSVSGKINLRATLTGDMSLNEMPSISITGNVERLTIDDMRLPFPIRNMSANFEINDSDITISDARGNLDLAEFSGNYWQRGFFKRQQWHCDGELSQFNFDHSPRLSQWLPDYFKKFCREYSPSGTSNIKFDLTDNGEGLKRSIIADLTDMSFSYVNMPYRVDNCIGKVNWIGDVCDFDVQSFSGNEGIKFKGMTKGIGGQSTFEINIFVPDKLPIDQKMIDAVSVNPKLAGIIGAFNATGGVCGIGKIERRVPDGEVNKSFDFRLKRCSIRHDKFDYPIHNVGGLIQVRNKNYFFSELSGNNSSGKVTCNGSWNPINGLDVRFLCESVPLNDQLRFALKPDLREIWNGFRPRGTLDFIRVDMRLPTDASEVDLTVEARMTKTIDETAANHVSIYPVWFPYELNHVTGIVNIGDGQITLKDCEGNHQRTTMFCHGDGRYSDDAWSVTLRNLLVTSLKVDDDLLAAVPRVLAPPIRQLKYQGLLGVSGELTVAGNSRNRQSILSSTQQAVVQTNNATGGDFAPRVPTSTPSHPGPSSSLSWDVRFDMTQAKMQIGLPIENIFGTVNLIGAYDGQTTECSGELDIDSMTIYDAQITKVRGPIWLDNSRVLAGQFCRRENKNAAPDFSPIETPTDFAKSVTGQMQKGMVTFDARMNSGGNNNYYLQASLSNGCLSAACQELGVNSDKIAGSSTAAIRLAGDYSGIHSQHGDGIIRISNAKIYEPFSSLLKTLNIQHLSRTAFDSSNIDFTVQGENIDINRIEFLGDAISLIGNGRMNLDREIDLNFYSIMGRDQKNFPMLRKLYHASSQNFLWINVVGTLDNPQTFRHPLPQLNDTLRKLFEPREKTGIASLFNRPLQHSARRVNQNNSQPNSMNTIRR